MGCPPIPLFCFDDLNFKDVVRLVCTHYKVKITLLTVTRCLAYDVTHYVHCFEHIVLLPQMSAHPLSEPNVRCNHICIGPFSRDYGNNN